MKKVFSLKSSIILFVLLLLTLLTFSGWCQNKPIELRFGHGDSPTTFTAVNWFEPWAKNMEEATNGKIRITIYPSQTLHRTADALSALKSGVTDINTCALAMFTGMFDLTEVLFLPFLSTKEPNAERYARTIQELYDTTPEIQEEFTRGDLKVLHLSALESYSIATRNKPIHKLEDIKGLKIRCSGLVPSEVVERLGATPVHIEIQDMYDACSKGVIDGALITRDMMASYNLHQVLPYWTKAPLWVSIVGGWMDKDRFERLPSDVQEQIMSANGLKASVARAEAMYGPNAEKYFEDIQKRDNKFITWYTLTEEEILRWREVAGKPIWDKWVAEKEAKGLPAKAILEKTIELLEKY